MLFEVERNTERTLFMTFKDFTKAVVRDLYEILEGNPTISDNSIVKNNGVYKTGITIMYPGEVISPNIYLNDFYREDISEDEVMKVAMAIKGYYYKCRPKKSFDVSFFLNYEDVKDRIFLKIINESLNEELLKNVPHFPFLDMQVVAYCKVCDETIGSGSILVLYSHIEKWGIDEEKLFKDAYINLLNNEEPELMDITDILENMLGQTSLTMDEKESIQGDIDSLKEMYDTLPMHVLSNKERLFGASIILNEDYLYNLCKSFNSDFYILPSSIHELILIPKNYASSVWELKDMVRTVNETSVVREELLSNSVYYFSERERRVMLAM